MEKPNRILTTALWCILVLLMLFLIGSGLWDPRKHSSAADLEQLFPVPHFNLTDQNKKPLSDKDLLGHTWVCDFVFTRCGNPCPTVTANMAALQKTLSPSVKFISF